MDGFRTAKLAEKPARERALDRVAEATHRLNQAVRSAVAEGLSVELRRASRCHDGAGNWGDQMVPTVRDAEAAL